MRLWEDFLNHFPPGFYFYFIYLFIYLEYPHLYSGRGEREFWVVTHPTLLWGLSLLSPAPLSFVGEGGGPGGRGHRELVEGEWAGGGDVGRPGWGGAASIVFACSARVGGQVCPEGPGRRTVSYTCVNRGSAGGVGPLEVLLPSELASHLHFQASACLICGMSRYSPFQAAGEEEGGRESGVGAKPAGGTQAG